MNDMDSDSSPNKKSSKSRGRGKSPRGAQRGRPRGRGRGRRAAKVIESDEETEEEQQETTVASKESDSENEKPSVSIEETPSKPEYDLEADISQLQAPTFTTINRGPPEPMLRLDWTLPVNLIGEKVLNPMIHCCDKCLKPILIYGRLIPCKHVFCLGCGRKEDGQSCPRCREKVVRVEQTSLGNVFMCTHGGSRYGNDGCRRTYLSQRDLQAHINHRHLRLTSSSNPSAADKEPQKISTVALSHPHQSSNSSRSTAVSSQHIPVLNTRSNLVSVPIQDTPPPPPSQPQQQPAPYFASVGPASSASTYSSYGTYSGSQPSAFHGSNFYTSSGQVSANAYPNYQQPPPSVLPAVHGHQTYDSHGSSYNNQWSTSSSNNYYR